MGVRGSFWNLWANPAGIAGVESMEAGVFFERRFLLNKLNFGTAGFVMPFKQTPLCRCRILGHGIWRIQRKQCGPQLRHHPV